MLIKFRNYFEEECFNEVYAEVVSEDETTVITEYGNKVEKKDIVLLLEIKKIEQKIAKKCTLEEIKTITEELENKKLSSRYGGVL